MEWGIQLDQLGCFMRGARGASISQVRPLALLPHVESHGACTLKFNTVLLALLLHEGSHEVYIGLD